MLQDLKLILWTKSRLWRLILPAKPNLMPCMNL